MADFLEAYRVGRDNEGGYCNVKGDNGGETYAGIARNFHPNWAGWAIIEQHELKFNEVLKDEQLESLVKQFYRANYWNKILGDYIEIQSVATFIYDWCINSGKAVRQIQRVLGITDDNQFGNGTLKAVNDAGEFLLAKLHKAREDYYRSLVAKDATQGKFLKGWLTRNNSLYDRLS